jgi:hypothetical protein
MSLLTGAITWRVAFDKLNTSRIVVTVTITITPISDATTDAGPCSAFIPA